MIVLGCLSGVAEGSFHLGQDTTSRGGPDLEALRQKGILLEFLRPSRWGEYISSKLYLCRLIILDERKQSKQERHCT
jgi:hypothetical protein